MKLVLAVILVAASAFAQEAAAAPAPFPQTACGPTDVQFQIKLGNGHQPDSKVENGKALVYVIEDQRFKAAKDVTLRVGLDGAWVGATRGNSYLPLSVEPGEHHLCASIMPGFLPSGHGVSLFALTAEAGKVYYLRAQTTGGHSSAFDENGWGDVLSVDVDLVNRDEGKYLVASSPLSVSRPKNSKDEKK